MNWLRFEQIVPAIAKSLPQVPFCGNPIPPALGHHFDSALVNPNHEREIVSQIVGIHRAFVAKSKVGTGRRKPDALLVFSTQRPGSPRIDNALARGAAEPGAAVRRNRQCAGLGERSGGRREVFTLGFTGAIPCVWVQGAKLPCVGSRDEVHWSPRSGLRSMCFLAKRHMSQ